MDNSKLELVWAAGFYDGEGSISFARANMLELGLKQIDPEPLIRFQKAVKLGKVNGPYPTKWNPIWQYIVYNKEVVQVFELIEPYICEFRREVGIDTILEWKKYLEKTHPPYIHGTRRMYITKKCRCELCRQANRDYLQEYKRRPGP